MIAWPWHGIRDEKLKVDYSFKEREAGKSYEADKDNRENNVDGEWYDSPRRIIGGEGNQETNW